MDKFIVWLASSPIASALKVGVAASLGYVLANPEMLNVPPIVVVGIVAAIPTLINWFNPADDRYGVGHDA